MGLSATLICLRRGRCGGESPAPTPDPCPPERGGEIPRPSSARDADGSASGKVARNARPREMTKMEGRRPRLVSPDALYELVRDASDGSQVAVSLARGAIPLRKAGINIS